MIRIFLALSFVFSLMLLSAAESPAQTPDRHQLISEIESLRQQIRDKEKELLAVSPEDALVAGTQTDKSQGGVIRLLPREKYDGVLSIRGGGSYYSFTRLTHDYGYGSDLSLEQGRFRVGFAGADFGMIASLGDTPLDVIPTDHPAFVYLAEFIPPEKETEARAQYRHLSSGVLVGSLQFSIFIPVQEGYTYLLRSIGYEHSDVLVAFKVLRKDFDGSVVLQWKMLKQYPIPHLERTAAN